MLEKIITKDNISVFGLSLALIACVCLGYSSEVACAIGGALGGVVSAKKLGE